MRRGERLLPEKLLGLRAVVSEIHQLQAQRTVVHSPTLKPDPHIDHE